MSVGKKEKLKKVTPQCIVIVVLLIMITFMIIILLTSRSTIEVKNKYYSDDCIKLENQTENIHINANVVQSNGSLVMLVSSDASDPMMINIDVSFLNDSNEVVYSDRVSTLVMNDGQALLSTALPDLGDDYAGNILLDVDDDSTSFDDYVENSEITYEESHEVLEDNTTVFNITGTNASDTNIEHLAGWVVALRDDDIVAFGHFILDNVEANSDFSTEVQLHGILSDNTVVPVQYDDLLIFTSSATTI